MPNTEADKSKQQLIKTETANQPEQDQLLESTTIDGFHREGALEELRQDILPSDTSTVMDAFNALREGVDINAKD